MLSYMEAVGFTYEVIKVKIGDIDQTVPRVVIVYNSGHRLLVPNFRMRGQCEILR